MTIIKDLRDSGDLITFFDFRGGNFYDQSGNGHVLTVPATASLTNRGLHVTSTPASIPLDLSSTQHIGVFFLVAGAQYADNSLGQMYVEHTTDFQSVAGSFAMYRSATNVTWLSFIAGSGGGGWNSYLSDNVRAKSMFMSAEIDRQRALTSGNTWINGIFDTVPVTETNYNDGSTFADSTTYLMSRSDSSLVSHGRMQVFGIVDFSTTRLTYTQQLQLYQEIRDKLTV